MSQDGKLQVIPKDIDGDPVPGFDCEHDGWVYARQKTGFGRCTRGFTHCLKCQGPATRFRKGFVCAKMCA